ncbi:hypothetical protein [Paenibacillus sp. USDA918EY]|uniref:hypothetical protein n=1 Tax=Paenibacillus sp. USDA918EY TaxID=2689575 RepID=UPI001F44BDA0|nr:hypothetical protein [Paenibacillus sp. USDA918EY]
MNYKKRGGLGLTTIIQKMNPETGLSELRCRLPKQMRQAVTDLIEADSGSEYFYKLLTDHAQIQLLLIEHNPQEHYTECHCFSTDMGDPGYAYESLPLFSIRMFAEMAGSLNLA